MVDPVPVFVDLPAQSTHLALVVEALYDETVSVQHFADDAMLLSRLLADLAVVAIESCIVPLPDLSLLLAWIELREVFELQRTKSPPKRLEVIEPFLRLIHQKTHDLPPQLVHRDGLKGLWDEALVPLGANLLSVEQLDWLQVSQDHQQNLSHVEPLHE